MGTLMRAIALLRPGIDCADMDGTLEGIRWDTPDVVPPTQGEVDLFFARSAALESVAAAFAAQVAAGAPYGDKRIQIGDADRANISGQSARALAAIIPGSGVTWPADFAWRMADDSYQPLPTAADMLQLGGVAGDRYAFLFFRRSALKDAIAAATSAAEIAGIDVDDGWS